MNKERNLLIFTAIIVLAFIAWGASYSITQLYIEKDMREMGFTKEPVREGETIKSYRWVKDD